MYKFRSDLQFLFWSTVLKNFFLREKIQTSLQHPWWKCLYMFAAIERKALSVYFTVSNCVHNGLVIGLRTVILTWGRSLSWNSFPCWLQTGILEQFTICQNAVALNFDCSSAVNTFGQIFKTPRFRNTESISWFKLLTKSSHMLPISVWIEYRRSLSTDVKFLYQYWNFWLNLKLVQILYFFDCPVVCLVAFFV